MVRDHLDRSKVWATCSESRFPARDEPASLLNQRCPGRRPPPARRPGRSSGSPEWPLTQSNATSPRSMNSVTSGSHRSRLATGFLALLVQSRSSQPRHQRSRKQLTTYVESLTTRSGPWLARIASRAARISIRWLVVWSSRPESKLPGARWCPAPRPSRRGRGCPSRPRRSTRAWRRPGRASGRAGASYAGAWWGSREQPSRPLRSAHERDRRCLADLRRLRVGRRAGVRRPHRRDVPPRQGARHRPDRLRPARRAQRLPAAHRRRADPRARARAHLERRRLRAAHRQRAVGEERQVGLLHRWRPADPRAHGLPVRRGRGPPRVRRPGAASGGCTSWSASG